MNEQGQPIQIADRDWVEVRVKPERTAPVRWNGKDYPPGASIIARYYEVKPGLAKQFDLVALRRDHDPSQQAAEEVLPGPEPAE